MNNISCLALTQDLSDDVQILTAILSDGTENLKN